MARMENWPTLVLGKLVSWLSRLMINVRAYYFSESCLDIANG